MSKRIFFRFILLFIILTAGATGYSECTEPLAKLSAGTSAAQPTTVQGDARVSSGLQIKKPYTVGPYRLTFGNDGFVQFINGDIAIPAHYKVKGNRVEVTSFDGLESHIFRLTSDGRLKEISSSKKSPQEDPTFQKNKKILEDLLGKNGARPGKVQGDARVPSGLQMRKPYTVGPYRLTFGNDGFVQFINGDIAIPAHYKVKGNRVEVTSFDGLESHVFRLTSDGRLKEVSSSKKSPQDDPTFQKNKKILEGLLGKNGVRPEVQGDARVPKVAKSANIPDGTAGAKLTPEEFARKFNSGELSDLELEAHFAEQEAAAKNNPNYSLDPYQWEIHKRNTRIRLAEIRKLSRKASAAQAGKVQGDARVAKSGQRIPVDGDDGFTNLIPDPNNPGRLIPPSKFPKQPLPKPPERGRRIPVDGDDGFTNLIPDPNNPGRLVPPTKLDKSADRYPYIKVYKTLDDLGIDPRVVGQTKKGGKEAWAITVASEKDAAKVPKTIDGKPVVVRVAGPVVPLSASPKDAGAAQPTIVQGDARVPKGDTDVDHTGDSKRTSQPTGMILLTDDDDTLPVTRGQLYADGLARNKRVASAIEKWLDQSAYKGKVKLVGRMEMGQGAMPYLAFTYDKSVDVEKFSKALHRKFPKDIEFALEGDKMKAALLNIDSPGPTNTRAQPTIVQGDARVPGSDWRHTTAGQAWILAHGRNSIPPWVKAENQGTEEEPAAKSPSKGSRRGKPSKSDGVTPSSGTAKSTDGEVDKQIDELVSTADVANGWNADKEYDPKTYNREAAVKAAKDYIKEHWHQPGVTTWKLVTGVKNAAHTIEKEIPQDDPKKTPSLLRQLDKSGLIQDVVVYGLDKVNWKKGDFYSLPYVVDIYIKYPSGKGKKVRLFYETGD